MTDKWGAKWVCGLGISIPAIVNALSPLAAQRNYIWLVVIRIIVGAFHGLVHSSLFSMYAKWFPTQERTTAIAATQFGGNIGAVFMSPIAGFLAGVEFGGGWPSIFYFSSLIHIIWLLMWWWFAHNSPDEDPNIDPEEHLYILQNINSNITIKVIETISGIVTNILSGTYGILFIEKIVGSVEENTNIPCRLRFNIGQNERNIWLLCFGDVCPHVFRSDF